MRRVGIAVVILFALWYGWSSTEDRGLDQEVLKHHLTIGRFEAITTNMPRDQVVRIMGRPGEIEGDSRMPSGTWTTEVWRDGSRYVSVTFLNDRVEHAYQSGLR